MIRSRSAKGLIDFFLELDGEQLFNWVQWTEHNI